MNLIGDHSNSNLSLEAVTTNVKIQTNNKLLTRQLDLLLLLLFCDDSLPLLFSYEYPIDM